MRLGYRVRLAWGLLPGDLMAELIIRGCRVPASSRRRTTLVEPGRGAVQLVLVENVRLARYLDLTIGGIQPLAQTLGRHVLARGPLSAATIRHEAEHVRQWERLGPLFLPLYLIESARALLRGQSHYFGNRFELEAQAREAESAEPASETAEIGARGCWPGVIEPA